MTTEADYKAWLKTESAQRIMLLDIQGYDIAVSSDIPQTLHIATHDFVAATDDTVPNQIYSGVIANEIELEQRVDGYTLSSIDVIRSDITERLLTMALSGEAMTLYHGDVSWPRDDFYPVFQGACLGITSSDAESITLGVTQQDNKLDTLIEGPVCFGSVSNLTPKLLNPATLMYQFHDGDVDYFTVRDQGLELTESVDYTDNNNGTFTLSSSPTGLITCDVTVSEYWSRESIAINICTRVGQEHAITDSIRGYIINLYVAEFETARSLLSKLNAGFGQGFSVDVNGRLALIDIQAPAIFYPSWLSINFVPLTAQDVVSISLDSKLGHLRSYTALAEKNWTPQVNFAGAVDDFFRKLYSVDYTYVGLDNGNTIFASRGDATKEEIPYGILKGPSSVSHAPYYSTTIMINPHVDRQFDVLSNKPELWRIECFMDATVDLALGQQIYIDIDQQGFNQLVDADNGDVYLGAVPVILMGKTINYQSELVELLVFKNFVKVSL